MPTSSFGPEFSIFLSSTFQDLKDHRDAVLDVIHTLGLTPHSMEYFGAQSRTPKEACIEMLRASDVYLGIFGMMYGSVESESGKSFTQLEYEEAVKLNKHMLIYIIDENEHPILPKYVDVGPSRQKLDELKADLRNRLVVKKFVSITDLAKSVSEGLHKFVQEQRPTGLSTPPSAKPQESPSLTDAEKKQFLASKAHQSLNQILFRDNRTEFFQKYIESIYQRRGEIEDKFLQKFIQQREKKCFVVTGQAGKGKTSLLCNLANSLKNSEQWQESQLAMLLNAAHFNIEEQNLESILTSFFASEKFNPTFDEIGSVLKKQNTLLVIFIDAINEIKNRSSFIQFNLDLTTALETIDREGYPILFCMSCRTEFWRQFYLMDWVSQIYAPLSEEIGQPSAEISNFELGEVDEVTQKYFQWYNIKGELIGSAKKSCSDPLMLRHLCTAYSKRPLNDKSKASNHFPEQQVGQIKTLRRKEAFDRFVKSKHTVIFERTRKHLDAILQTEAHYQDSVMRYTTDYLMQIANRMFEKRQTGLKIDEIYEIATSLDHPDATLDSNIRINKNKLRTDPQSVFFGFLDEDILFENRNYGSYDFTFEAYFEYCLGCYFALERWPKLDEDGNYSIHHPKKIRRAVILEDFKALLANHANSVETSNFNNLFGALQFAVLITEEDKLYAEEPFLFVALIQKMVDFGVQGFDWIQQACATIRETKLLQVETWNISQSLPVIEANKQKLEKIFGLLDKLMVRSDFFIMWDINVTLSLLAQANFEFTLRHIMNWAVDGKGLQPVVAAQSLIKISEFGPDPVIESLFSLSEKKKYLTNFWLARSVIYTVLELFRRDREGRMLNEKTRKQLFELVYHFAKDSSVPSVRSVALAALPFLSQNQVDRLLLVEKCAAAENYPWAIWNLAIELQHWPQEWPADADAWLWKMFDRLLDQTDDHIRYALLKSLANLKVRNAKQASLLIDRIPPSRWQLDPIPNRFDRTKHDLPGMIYFPAYLEPATDHHIECRERLQMVLQKLIDIGEHRFNWVDPRLASEADLRFAHNEDTDRHRDRSIWKNYIEDVKQSGSANKQNKSDSRDITGPTELRKESFESALLCVGGILCAIDYVFNGPAEFASSLGRFPGHLANNTVSIFNNIAIGACYARQYYQKTRMIIIDCDVHHGIHTNRVFAHDPNIIYFSMHVQSSYAREEGSIESIGEKEGWGYSFNIPYPEGMPDEGYKYIIDKLLYPILKDFKPELILISAGFDGHVEDSLTQNCILTDASFIHLAKTIRGIMDEQQVKVVTSFEGGYGLNSFANCFVHMANILGKMNVDEAEIGFTPLPENYSEMINPDSLMEVESLVQQRIELMWMVKENRPEYPFLLDAVYWRQS